MAVLIDHGRGLYPDSRVFTIGLPTAPNQRGGAAKLTIIAKVLLREDPWQKG
jgi:hypothetical protein